MRATADPIILKEYEPTRLPSARLSSADGKRLWQDFKDKISVTTPSFKNDDHWELTSQGWVGFIPFSEELSFHLQPKVPLKNLFGMWEYAYRLKSFTVLPDLYQCATLQQFYEQLAVVLAKKILDRSRKGYYRAYIPRSEELSFLRGRLDFHHHLNRPWEPRLQCHYQENTADVTDNQILAWTLNVILRSGFCTERVLPLLRKCYRSLGQAVSLQPCSPRDCLRRLYNRLNQDYQPLHALCRFFLENTGPTYEVGDHAMAPFLVNMSRLFEQFVAEWLRVHLPQKYELNDQETIHLDPQGEISSQIDLVLYEAGSKQPLWVLDTKYKNPESPSTSDINQVSFYALHKQCTQAALVYPGRLRKPLDIIEGNIRIRTLTFSLAGDLEQGGQQFMSALLGN